MSQTSLELDTERHKHCQLVQKHIESIIDQKGPLDFKTYMAKVLYAPGLGYYSSGRHKLGREGDFITSPELTPLFAQTLARQCGQVLSQCTNGHILETGPGSGQMAADLLLALEQQQQLPEQYWLLELSSDLQNRQYRTIQQHAGHLLDRVHWLTEWPGPFEGVILANEVLDAMPVHLVHYTQEQFQQYHVSYDHNGFQWQLWPIQSPELANKLSDIEPYLTEDYTLEINTDIKPWLSSVGDILSRGAALIIDYGFPRHELYHPQRSMGTLMCHIGQRAHTDPLACPGVQDITAHIDFTEVGESALSAGLRVAGYTTQSDFLMNCGITELMPQDMDSAAAVQTAQHVKMLTMPGEMGELFKVMALTRDLNTSLIGFRHNDHRHRLG